MDDAAVAALSRSRSWSSVPALVFARDDGGKIVAQREGVQVQVAEGAEGTETLTLRPIRELFRGSRKAPDLSRGPTPELEPFFMLLEYTVVRFCEANGRDETDQDMERIFALLRRRPDSQGGLLFSYLRAAAQFYMSARDVSQAEYEAVMSRLAKSARTFSIAPISRNYLATLGDTFAAMARR